MCVIDNARERGRGRERRERGRESREREEREEREIESLRRSKADVHFDKTNHLCGMIH